MWDETLIESKGRRAKGKWFALPLSFAAHAFLIGALIGVSYWAVEAVQAPHLPAGPLVVPISVDSGGGGSAARNSSSRKPIKQMISSASLPSRMVPEARNVAIDDLSPADVSNNVDEGPGVPGPGAGFGTGPGPGSIPGEGNSELPVVLTPDIRQPVLLRKVEPPYPVMAMRARIQGVVILEAVISRKGTVQDIKLLRSAHPLLDDAAIAAVKQWIYRPALFNNKPISVYFRVTVEFRLQ